MNIKQTSRSICDKRVFIGLSGGVDSAVSAGLLKQQGYDVTGVFIKVWQPDFLPCSWRDERRDAMRVAIALNIPFLFFDFEKEYKKGVVDKMISEYKAGRTPNPDVLCNREIKFGAFWKKAKAMGADYIATGHYWSGEKNQSYFLWTLTPEDLSHTLFPVGNMEKSEVRKLAKKFNLPVSEKKDSQGVCFIGEVTMEEFLSHFIETKPGKVLDISGKVIGTHQGAVLYTIGERHGFDIEKKNPEAGAYYTVSKNLKANTITVSNSLQEISTLSPTKVSLTKVNWITEPKIPEVLAQIRYRGEKIPVTLALTSKKLTAEFPKPIRGLSLGQSIVFYVDLENNYSQCLGGAVMDKVLE
ncbi:MAG: tRNA 2-thiouridine(34) synthase MnmA [Candidatus Zambryskibacteria bacterium]|nr:tRNA 2-thiouridine(34) synthase MnmA [Candidatus Zambryskibacteria bacterium]